MQMRTLWVLRLLFWRRVDFGSCTVRACHRGFLNAVGGGRHGDLSYLSRQTLRVPMWQRSSSAGTRWRFLVGPRYRLSVINGPGRGAIGGAADEAGGEYRRAVAAFFTAHGLNRAPVTVSDIPPSKAIVQMVRLETDEAVDDIEVELVPPYRLLIQAKRKLTKKTFGVAVQQWVKAVRRQGFDPLHHRLVLVAGDSPQWARTLGAVLDAERGRMRGGRTQQEQRAMDNLDRELSDLSDEERSSVKSAAVLLTLFVEEERFEHSQRALLLLDGRVVAGGEGLFAWRDLIRAAGTFARGRTGGDMDLWRNALRDSGRTLLGGKNDYLPDGTIPRTLPVGPLMFVNRKRELDSLTRLFDRAKSSSGPVVAVVTGIPGIGKTSVGKHWALLNRHRFEDGDLFADFSSRPAAELPAMEAVAATRALVDRGGTTSRESGGGDVSEVLGGFLKRLGVSDWAIPSDYEGRADMFRSITAFKRLLILLDDVAWPTEVTPLLPVGRGSMVIVTAKRRLPQLLREGARPLELEPLDAAAARELLKEVVPERITAATSGVDRLVEICDGLPIALSVCGRWLGGGKDRTVAGLVARLTDPMRRPQALAVPGDPSLDDVFDIAYLDLNSQAALVYRRIGIHPGRDVDPQDVAVLSGIAVEDAESALGMLHERHLVEVVANERYQMHSRIHEHSKKCGQELDSLETRERALRKLVDRYYAWALAADRALIPDRLRVAVEEGTAQDQPFFTSATHAGDWFDAERSNILAILNAAFVREWDARVWPIVEALWNFYSTRRPYLEWEESHKLGVRSAERIGNPAAEAQMRKQLARVYVELREYEKAETELARGKAVARLSGDQKVIASVVEFTGYFLMETGELEGALKAFKQARATYRRVDVPRGVAIQDYFGGSVLLRMGAHKRAVRPLRSALRLVQEIGDGILEARILLRLGEAFQGMGAAQKAEEAAGDALILAEANRLPLEKAQAHELLAAIAHDAGRQEATYAEWSEARDIYGKLGHPRAREVATILARLKRGLPVGD